MKSRTGATSVRTLVVTLVMFTFLPLGVGDQASGPNRQTLLSQPWGSVFFDLNQVTKSGFFQVQQTLSGHEIRHGASKRASVSTAISKRSGKLVISGGGETISVSRNRGIWTFESAKTISIQRKLSATEVTMGDDSFTISRNPSQIKISGKKGTLLVTRSLSKRVFASEAGKTTVENRADNGFTISGAPLSAHPYVGRGLYVSLGVVGLFIDVWGIAGVENPSAGLIEWQPIK